MTARIEAMQRQMNDWRNDLQLTPTKTPKALLYNCLVALRGAPEWQGVLAYNEFGLETMAMKPPPWMKAHDNTWTPRIWTDHDDTLATNWLQEQGIGAIAEILSDLLGIEQARWTQLDQNRIARCLTKMGWERYRASQPPRPWRYRPAFLTAVPVSSQ